MMDRKKMLTILLTLTMTFSIFQYATAQVAPSDPAWYSTDGDSSTYTLSILDPDFGLNSGWSVGVYDYYSGVSGDYLKLIDYSNQSATIEIDSNGDIYVDNGVSAGSTLNLGLDNYFGFYFSNGTTKYYTYDYTSIPNANNQWALEFEGAGGPVIASDVNIVPIPASAFLLGAGLIGLIGFRRQVAKG